MPPDTLIAKSVGKTIHNAIERTDEKLSMCEDLSLKFTRIGNSIMKFFNLFVSFQVWIDFVKRVCASILPERMSNSKLALKILLSYRDDLYMLQYICNNMIG